MQYLGEEGEDCVLKAAVICANPWNLDVTNIALQRTWLGQQVYAKVMGSNLKKLFYEYVVYPWKRLLALTLNYLISHIDMLMNNPRIDLELVKSIKYIHHFDRWVPRHHLFQVLFPGRISVKHRCQVCASANVGLSVWRRIPPRCVLSRRSACDQNSFFCNSGRRRSCEELRNSFPWTHANSIWSHAYHVMGWSYRMVRNWRITLVRKTGMSSRRPKSKFHWIRWSILIRSPGG